MVRNWTDAEVKMWIDSQQGENQWYQSIPVRNGIVTPGSVNSMRRIAQFGLPDDLGGASVLDVGCNSGLLCFECKKRNAGRVVGIDLRQNRIEQAQTLAEIMELDVEFKKMSLFDAAELGQFDIVFCIAVLTEVTDLIGAVEVLKQVTKKTLFLELATIKPSGLETMVDRVIRRLGGSSTSFRPYGELKLRRVDSSRVKSWSLVPDEQSLMAILGRGYRMTDLGPSERYNLYRIDKTG